MFTFDTLMFILLRIWMVAFIYMIISKIISAAITGYRRGKIIAEIKNNVNKKLTELDEDMQKYYDYEVYDNDISDNRNDNEA